MTLPEGFSGDYNDLTNIPNFGMVAYSNNYNDLSNRPTNVSELANDAGYLTSVPEQQQADWNETNTSSKSYIQNKPEIPTVPTQVSALNNDAGYLTQQDLQNQTNANWMEENPASPAYIQNKPDLSGYLTTANLNNFVTKTDDEFIGGDKTFGDDVVLNGVNEVTGSLEVPSVLDNIGSNGNLNLSQITGTGNCEQAMNFCDMQDIYNDLLNRINALTDQVDDLLDSIHKLNKAQNTPKDGEACPNTPTVTDIDGNTYSTVRIGNQCWMRENLRTTKMPNGSSLVESSSSSTSEGHYYNPAGGATAVPVQGYRYNFYAISNGLTAASSNIIQGICPVGWHVPTTADWSELQTYVGLQSQYLCDGNSGVAKSLCSPSYWPSTTSNECYPGYNPENNNATGFSAVPASSTTQAYFWASNGYSSISNTSFYLSVGFSVTATPYLKSVRCIRDHANGESNTVEAPTVTTVEPTFVYDINQVSAKIRRIGVVEDDGGMSVRRIGIVWGTNSDVKIGHAVNGNYYEMTGLYTVPHQILPDGSTYTITGLTTNTQYYYRAFAINAIDTAYGEAKSFKTTKDGNPCPNAATVTDIDGNTYNTVMIGTQCWMRQNLKVTKTADNTSISSSPATHPVTAVNNAAGRLYLKSVAMTNPVGIAGQHGSGVQMLDYERGICPVGWHIPSNAEINTLVSYVGTTATARKLAMKGTSNLQVWASSSESGSPGYDQTNNDMFNFSAIPNQGDQLFSIWSATGNYVFAIAYNSASTQLQSISTSNLLTTKAGVRCIKDDPATENPTIDLPTVTLTNNGAGTNSLYAKRLTANVSDNGGSEITQRYIVCSKSTNPTYSASLKYVFTDNTAGDFFQYIDLEPSTTYYVRACAKNSMGWSYSSQISFTTPADGKAMRCQNAPNVSDANNNTYPTIQLGSQCWMAQNLRSTTYPGGGSISYKIPNGASSVNTNYGRLYTYDAALNGSAPSDTYPVQGICPTGWHLPSRAEVNSLLSYIGSQSDYQCNSSSTNNAKALASTSGWNESTVDCAVGNDQSSNNASGFNAFPAGSIITSTNGSSSYGVRTDFWINRVVSAAEPTFYLYNDNSYILITNVQTNTYSHSVRCIKGNTPPSVATGNVITSGPNTATLGGILYTTGGDNVTQLGICYSNSANPTIDDNKSTVTYTMGNYSISITGLTAGVTYYYRAFATNANGTQYGKVKSFTTKAPPTVSQGNVYSQSKTTVNIANIAAVSNDATIVKVGVALYKRNSDGTYPQQYSKIVFQNNPGTFSIFTYSVDVTGLVAGATYKWKGCLIYNFGNGTPNDTVFATNLSSASFTTFKNAAISMGNASRDLTATTHLKYNVPLTITVGNPAATTFGLLFSTNSSHLTLTTYEPYHNYVQYTNVTENYTHFFSFNGDFDADTLYYRAYVYNEGGDTVYSSIKYVISPRKVQQVFNVNALRMTNTTATIKYLWTSQDDQNQPAANYTGVVYSTTNTNPTIGGSGVYNVSSNHSTFIDKKDSVQLTGLSGNTTYYVRAYVKNCAGTRYSGVYQFTTPITCGQQLTASNSGNTYSTVLIGSKCWMAQNLRETSYYTASGTANYVEIYNHDTWATQQWNYRYRATTPGSLEQYGYLYNRTAYMGTGTTNSAGYIRGICPQGWHIPQYEELTNLMHKIQNNSNLFSYFNTYPGYWEPDSGLGIGMHEFGQSVTYAAHGCRFKITSTSLKIDVHDEQEGITVRCVQDFTY